MVGNLDENVQFDISNLICLRKAQTMKFTFQTKRSLVFSLVSEGLIR